MHEEFNFTLDAAANEYNHLLPKYYTEETDGLAHSWERERVFCNPPYDGVELPKWINKALKREADISVLLLPASIDTPWFHFILETLGESIGMQGKILGGRKWNGIWWVGADLLFMKGRLRFWRPPNAHHPSSGLYEPIYGEPSEPGPSPRAGNMLLIVRK